MEHSIRIEIENFYVATDLKENWATMGFTMRRGLVKIEVKDISISVQDANRIMKYGEILRETVKNLEDPDYPGTQI